MTDNIKILLFKINVRGAKEQFRAKLQPYLNTSHRLIKGTHCKGCQIFTRYDNNIDESLQYADK